jgi:hypothetical protein
MSYPMQNMQPQQNRPGNFWTGSEGYFDQRSNLGPQQQQGFQNLINAGNQAGAGGGFGQSADYYRSLLNNNGGDFQALAAPDVRQFRQETLPGLAEQFAGYGAGGLNSSGYRNSVLQANTDLGERLASLRANLRGQGAQGLQGIAQQGLGNYFQNTYTPQTPGFLQAIAPGLGQGLAAGATGGLSGLSSLLPFLQKLFQGNSDSLRDNISNGPAAGPYNRGATYNPYTGLQS